eukprot:Nk52_evm39s2309 gene=Nk52_evmTU39s2309
MGLFSSSSSKGKVYYNQKARRSSAYSTAGEMDYAMSQDSCDDVPLMSSYNIEDERMADASMEGGIFSSTEHAGGRSGTQQSGGLDHLNSSQYNHYIDNASVYRNYVKRSFNIFCHESLLDFKALFWNVKFFKVLCINIYAIAGFLLIYWYRVTSDTNDDVISVIELVLLMCHFIGVMALLAQQVLRKAVYFFLLIFYGTFYMVVGFTGLQLAESGKSRQRFSDSLINVPSLLFLFPYMFWLAARFTLRDNEDHLDEDSFMSSINLDQSPDFGTREYDNNRRRSVVRYFRIFSSVEPSDANRTTIAGGAGVMNGGSNRHASPLYANNDLSTMEDLESITEDANIDMSGLGRGGSGAMSGETVEPFDQKVAFRYNFWLYFMAFLIGLHVNLLNQIPSFYITISLDSFDDINVVDMVAGIVIICLISFLLLYHLYLHFRIGSLLNALTGYTFVAAVLAGLCFAVKDEYTFHFHHYFTTLLLMPLARFRTPLSTVTQGFLIGFCLNGVIIYGPVANFEPVAEASNTLEVATAGDIL